MDLFMLCANPNKSNRGSACGPPVYALVLPYAGRFGKMTGGYWPPTM